MRVADQPAGARTGSPPGGRGLLWPTAVVLTGAIMSSLSGSAVTTTLPELTEVFNVTPAAVAWVVVAQSLAIATLLTVFGSLSDLIGRRSIYLTGMVLTVVSSALCGLSGSIGQLIAFRLVFGIASAMVAANSLAFLISIYPPTRRGFLVGLWEAGIATGLAIGPAVGGLILGTFGWRGVFFLPVVIGSLLLPLIPGAMVEAPRAATERRRFDYLGAALFAAALAPLLFALTSGRGTGWTSPPILACFGVSIVALTAFLIVERRTPQPMVDLSMFRGRGFSAGNLAKVTAYFAFAATTFLLPFYWVRVLDLPPGTLGLTLTAFPIGMLIGSMAFGSLSDKVGTRLLAPAGMAVMAVASVIQTQVSGELGMPPVLVAAFLAGLGVGAFIAPNDSAILAVTPPDRIGVANGIMGVSRSLGLLFGQAFAGEILTARLVANNGAFLPSYHQVFYLVIAVCLVGIALAAVRD
jgi:EmrB/QacA subfamily drug resistance transporter